MSLDKNSIKNFFEKNGYIYLKNFFNEKEIKVVENRCAEITENLNFLYIFKKSEINNLKISKTIKKKILLNFKYEDEIYLKNLGEFTNFTNQFLNDLSKKNKLFALEKIHKKFCKNFTDKSFDVILDEKLSKIFIKNKLIDILKSILNTNKLTYWCESGFQYNKPSIKGWHTDDPLNEQNNTFGETCQVRVAMYFQSNPNLSGGLKLLPRSNLKIRLRDYLKGFLRGKYKLKDSLKINFNLAKNLFPNPGDLIIWDKRIFHSPWATQIYFFKNICLPPFIEEILPRFIRKPPSFPRSLIAFDVGKKSKDLSNYINEWISVRKDYSETWKKKGQNYKNLFYKLGESDFDFNDTCIKKNLNIK